MTEFLCTSESTTRTVLAGNALAACNKAFRPIPGWHWEVKREGSLSVMQDATVRDGDSVVHCYLEDNG